MLAAMDFRQDSLFFITPFFRDQDGDGPSDDFVSGVPKHLFCSGIPARDDSLRGLADDGIVCRFDDRTQKQFGLPGSLQRRDISRNGSRVLQSSLAPSRICIDENMTNGPVFPPHPCFAIDYRLVARKPGQDVFNDMFIDMKLGDVMPDVFVRRIAKHCQLSMVRPKDRSVGSCSMQTVDGVLEEVREFAFSFLPALSL